MVMRVENELFIDAELTIDSLPFKKGVDEYSEELKAGKELPTKASTDI